MGAFKQMQDKVTEIVIFAVYYIPEDTVKVLKINPVNDVIRERTLNHN